MNTENQLLLNQNILLSNLSKYPDLEDFCGRFIQVDENTENIEPNVFVYMYGDIDLLSQYVNENKVYVIGEYSYNNTTDYDVISLGYVPIHIHNVGVYFREFFDKDYFNMINEEHQFYTLTESNKPDTSYRKGVYLTNVEKNGEEYRYHLLRCSSNLGGATENFKSVDNDIINQVSEISEHFFSEKTEFNHVLAQMYMNSYNENNKQKKAKIKAHSDKTKDMLENGLMAFCTFYDTLNPKQRNGFDYQYKNQSVLTKLRFNLKPDIQDETLEKKFDIVLYPNSVFIMSLYTNRLYTHEIVPSLLNIEHLPIRLGYVIRCSKTYAVYKNGIPYIEYDKQLKEMHEMTEEERFNLKNLYYEENYTSNMIQYPEFLSSMNLGDYKKPIY